MMARPAALVMVMILSQVRRPSKPRHFVKKTLPLKVAAEGDRKGLRANSVALSYFGSGWLFDYRLLLLQCTKKKKEENGDVTSFFFYKVSAFNSKETFKMP